MATVSSKVFKHHKKSDGTFNVKICLCHKKRRKYIDTEHFVSEKKLAKSLEIKDDFINKLLNKTLDEYRDAISKLGKRIELFDVEGLREYLLVKDECVDFIKFCHIHIESLLQAGRVKSASNYRTVYYSLIDFFKREVVPIEEITIGVISSYERFLRSDRTVTRKNQHGKTVTIKCKGVSDASVHNYLRDFKGFFTAAQSYYNKPSLGINPITYNPFDEYKIVEPPITKKRNIEVNQLKSLRDCKVKPGSRAELARDLFMLSFYLCGINAVDLYASKYILKDGRLEYNRSKTKSKRKDKAFISIKIPDEALPLLSKYKNELPERYSSIGNLNAALSKGMNEISKLTGLPGITFYWSRHTFGNLARNTCRKSKDDVALALNHVDHGRKTTDIYLEKDWSIVDEVQEAVLNLFRDKKPQPAVASVRNFDIFSKQINLPCLHRL